MATEQHSGMGRLLVTHPGFYRHYRCGPFSMWILDRSSIPYLVEEFVASAAIEVVIPEPAADSNVMAGIPQSLIDRVRLVDKEQAALKSVDNILAPVYAEHEVEPSTYHLRPASEQGRWKDHNVATAIEAARQELHDFLLASTYELQVGLNLTRLKRALAFVRKASRSADARGTLAVLEGTVAVYRQVRVPGVRLRVASTSEQAERFHRFVQDANYRALSRATRLLGVPRAGGRGLEIVRRRTFDLLTHSKLRHLVKSGTKLISAASGGTAPDAEIAAPLVAAGYLPPVISMRSLYARAHAEWSRSGRKSVDEAFRQIRLKDEDRDFLMFAERHYDAKWTEDPLATQPRRIHRGVTMMLTNGGGKGPQEEFMRARADSD